MPTPRLPRRPHRVRGPANEVVPEAVKPALPSAAGPYSLREVARRIGISPRVVVQLVEAGFVAPVRGPRHAYLFSFRDIVLLRTAQALRQARVPPRRITASLARLRATLPAELPITAMRLSAVGGQVVVHDAIGPRHVDSGQRLFDFQVGDGPRVVALSEGRRAHATVPTAAPPAPARSAATWFREGERHETADPARAEAAYREALRLDPALADAWLNLGALMCEAGRCQEALALYDEALGRCPAEAGLHFNRAIALEDLGHAEEALRSYDRCLALAPGMADAHFNAGRLHERMGQAQQALRHFSAYRRLQG